MSDFKEDIAHLLDSSGNLKADVIKDYVHNATNADDTYAVEKHILNSPFDSEVVEGYQEMRRNKSADYYVNQIKLGIPAIVGPEKVLQINYKLIAASVVGLLGLVSIGYLVSSLDFSREAEMAVVTEEVEINERNSAPVAEVTVRMDTMILEESNVDEIAISQEITTPTLVAAPVVVRAEQELVEEIVTEEEIGVVAIAEVDLETEMLGNEVSKQVKLEEKDDVIVDPSPGMLAYSKEGYEDPKVSKRYEAKADKDGFTEATELRNEKSLLDEGGIRFKKKQYSDAAKFYALVLNSNPTQQAALTYGGLSNLYTGNYSKATTQLSAVSKKSDSIKWSLATAYLKIGRKESAKSILSDLDKNGSSNYKKKAKEVLATF